MKRFFYLPIPFFVFIVICLIQTSATSCTKDVTTVDTIIVTKTDTLQEKDTLLTKELLTANSWKIQELRALRNNEYIYYDRGGTINTQNFDNEYITFNTDGSGKYVDNNGTQTTLTWAFTDASNTKIIWVWNLSQPVTITWENIVYNNASISYTEYYTQFGYNILTAGIRIPK